MTPSPRSTAASKHRGSTLKVHHSAGHYLAPGLTPHSLRHSYKTLMEDLGTPKPLMDAQMGHSDGSVQARYSHVTTDMVGRLLDGLTSIWQDALHARREIASASPVAALDSLLRKGSAE